MLSVVLGACAGGGGGGGDSGATQRPSPKSFETPEYRANIGLSAIRASSVYARKATGEDITVGIIDTGIDIEYAVGNGANVINYSIGGGSSLSAVLADSMARAVDEGATLVLAAGNSGELEPSFPARFAIDPRADGQVITVGGVDADNQITSFSGRAGGAGETFLVAQGVDILTTGRDGTSALATGGSFATAHVSGAAALVVQGF
jgi:subtilisin family serine protease